MYKDLSINEAARILKLPVRIVEDQFGAKGFEVFRLRSGELAVFSGRIDDFLETFKPEEFELLFKKCSNCYEKVRVFQFQQEYIKELLPTRMQHCFLDLLVELAKDDRGFIWLHNPDIKELYKNILISLDEEVLGKAASVHYQLQVLSRDLDYKDLNKIMRELLFSLEERFPGLCKADEAVRDEIIDKVLCTTLQDFFEAPENKAFLEDFLKKYPKIYELFIYPLEKEAAPLYIFYCNPVFFGLIFVYLSNDNKQNEGKIINLENCLKEMSKRLGEGCYKSFLKRVHDEINGMVKKGTLQKNTKQLFGLHGELCFLHNYFRESNAGDHQITIPQDQKKKMADFRLCDRKNGRYKIIEVKSKMPSYGIDGVVGEVNDFLLNYSPSLVSFLHHICPGITPVEIFPSLCSFEGTSYGKSLRIAENITEKYSDLIYRECGARCKEEKLIKSVLISSYVTELSLLNGKLIGEDHERCQELKMAAKNSFEEVEFINNTIKRVFEQFEAEKKLAQDNGYIVTKYIMYWYFFLPGNLVVDPFAENPRKTTLDLYKHAQEIIQSSFKKVYESSCLKSDKVELKFQQDDLPF